ncbi:MAG: 50S ribosomal protein L31 [Chloroflexota bacterium]|nr:50S ribosomal protein L31 [Chloroflexota bacterium]
MKENIHPQFYPEAQVVCSCGNSWNVGATVPMIRTDICSKCHPFFTGEQRIVDTGGQVERFMKKLARSERMIADVEQREARKTSPELAILELDLRTRPKNVLVGGGLETVGDVLGKLEQEGDQALINLKGFGLKSLATLKKELRGRGFALPGEETSEAAGETDEEEEPAETAE